MFKSDDQKPTMSGGRYQARLVSGQMRQKSRQEKVQEALDEGSAMGWRPVGATTTNASGSFVTGIAGIQAPAGDAESGRRLRTFGCAGAGKTNSVSQSERRNLRPDLI